MKTGKLPKASNAQRTIESSIIMGLSERAHLTGATAEYVHIQVLDIIEAIFHSSVVWAVREYLRELGEYEEQPLQIGSLDIGKITKEE